MALLDTPFGKTTTLSELSKSAQRKEEIIIGKQRDRLFKRIEDIANSKQKIFQQGATQKSPDLRKALAQQFELKSQEQVMVARELNLRSKELMTVSRLRILQESKAAGKALGRLNVTDKDMVRITSWIEDDAVTQDMYQERLDQILELGAQSDKDALAQAGLTSAGQELMHLWDQMDKGHLKEDEALEEAEKTIRRKQGTMEKEL